MNRAARRAAHVPLAPRGSSQRCPKCGSHHVVHDPNLKFKGYGPGLAFCRNCECLWEPLDPAKLLDADDPQCSSFTEPCNNCAFRPGSPEQSDPEKWKSLIENLRHEDGRFYCHKGVPIESEAEHGYAYPTRTITIDVEGVPRTAKVVSDVRKLRLCRGYLMALGKWWDKQP
jgi:hypothetical protein